MTRSDYMKTLAKKLRRLPREDFNKAMEYFAEYFEEAGPENVQQAIHDLGTPQDAARELIMELAVKNAEEPPKTVKRGLSAVWIGILGVCAAPIALPLALALICVILALVITVLACLFSIFVSALAFIASGIVGAILGVIVMFSAFADGLTTVGLSLSVLGLGLISTFGSFVLCRWFLRKMSKSLGQITKGGKKNESIH